MTRNGMTSGSISIDTSGLAGVLVSALEPVLTQIDANLVSLAGQELGGEDAYRVLAEHMPVVAVPEDGPSLAAQVRYQADALALSGYVLVRRRSLPELSLGLPPEAAKHLKDTDTWFTGDTQEHPR